MTNLDNVFTKGLPVGSAGKEYACNAGDLGLIPGLGRCVYKAETSLCRQKSI